MKRQLNIRIDEKLLSLARAKSEAKGVTLTALVEQGLKLIVDETDALSDDNGRIYEPDSAYIQEVVSEYIHEYIQPQLDSMAKTIFELSQKDVINGASANKSDRPLIDREDLEKLSRDELRRYAHKVGVSMSSQKRKGELINDILAVPVQKQTQ